MKPRSPEFGNWVRTTREENRLSQQDLAKLASISQQTVSKIERTGIVPPDVSIERICMALHREMSEGLAIVNRQTTNQLFLLCEGSRREFIQRLSQHASKNDKVGVFFLEEGGPLDPQKFAIDWHRRVLDTSPKIYSSLLFRFPEDSINFNLYWHEMQRLVPGSENRFRGFNRHPNFVEDRNRALPVAREQILMTTPQGPDLYSHFLDPDAFDAELHLKTPHFEAKSKAMKLQPSTPERATKASQYLGLTSFTEVDPERWIHINPLASGNEK